MAKHPGKVEKVMIRLIVDGYFLKRSDVINIALFEYFKRQGLFSLTDSEENDGVE